MTSPITPSRKTEEKSLDIISGSQSGQFADYAHLARLAMALAMLTSSSKPERDNAKAQVRTWVRNAR